MEEVEQSGRRMVGEVQLRVERSGRRVGLNNERIFLFVWISSLSPDIIVKSLGFLSRVFTESKICAFWSMILI